MELTKEFFQKEIAALEQQKLQALANFNKVDGALQATKQLMDLLDKEEEPDDAADAGAGDPVPDEGAGREQPPEETA